MTPHQALTWDHASLLFQLARAAARHGDGSPEAEAIRDKMEATWPQLGEPGRSAIKRLSADLWRFEDSINEGDDRP